MADKNPSEMAKKHRHAFGAAFALIGLGLGFLLYTLGYKPEVILIGLFIGAGIGLLIDSMIGIKK